MDSHCQVPPECLEQLREAIEIDDPKRLQEAIADPEKPGSNRFKLNQTPFALIYDDNYDAGYILEGPRDAGYLVFDVVFLDKSVADAENADAAAAAGAAISQAAVSKSRRGHCTCAHYAALRGASKCLKWVLGSKDGRASLNLSHHSGQSIEEIATGDEVLELIFSENKAQSAAASSNSSRANSMSEIALTREQRLNNKLRNEVRFHKSKLDELHTVVGELHRKVETLQTQLESSHSELSEQRKQVYRANELAGQRQKDHAYTLDTVQHILSESDGGKVGQSTLDFFVKILHKEHRDGFAVESSSESSVSWVPEGSGLLAAKVLERTHHYKLIGARSKKNANAAEGTDKRAGRIQPVNFNAQTGQLEGANGVAFRAIDRQGHQIVLRGILEDQPYDYSHGSHPNLLSVRTRFRGSSSLLRPWVDAELPEQIEYAVVEFFPAVLAQSSLAARRLVNDEVASVLIQVGLGLVHLHEVCGIQHNALHERHIFLTETGFLKLGGFNQATKTDNSSKEGFVMNDVFLLGQLILRMAGNKVAQRFAARTTFDGRPHSIDTIPGLAHTFHQDLRSVVARMLDWDVSKRPSAREVVTIAQRVLFGNNAEATAESTVGSIKQWLLTESGSRVASTDTEVSITASSVTRYMRGLFLQQQARDLQASN